MKTFIRKIIGEEYDGLNLHGRQRTVLRQTIVETLVFGINYETK